MTSVDKLRGAHRRAGCASRNRLRARWRGPASHAAACGRLRAGLIVAVVALASAGCGDRAGAAHEAAVAAGTAEALRAFVARHPESEEAAEARTLLLQLGPPLPGFEARFPSEVAYSCHLGPEDPQAPIPSDVIAYSTKDGAEISWQRVASTFVYDPPFAMRPAVDAESPVGMGKNATGQSVRRGKRCINEVLFDGGTINVEGGVRFAPGGVLAGPRR